MTSQKNSIGERLRALRHSKKMTQAMVAARCGMMGWDASENTITKIENRIRCVSDHELIILAQAVRVKLKEFFPQHPSLF